MTVGGPNETYIAGLCVVPVIAEIDHSENVGLRMW